MRGLPFFKPKKGAQFAGLNFSDGSGGGGGGGGYTLPTATANRLGGIKVGSNLSVENDGTLSAIGGAVYSTTRFDTGCKWTDGRTIYGIVVPLSFTASITTGYRIAFPVNNIDTIIVADCRIGYSHETAGTITIVPTVVTESSGSDAGITISSDYTSVSRSYTGHLIIYYVETTS